MIFWTPLNPTKTNQNAHKSGPGGAPDRPGGAPEGPRPPSSCMVPDGISLARQIKLLNSSRKNTFNKIIGVFNRVRPLEGSVLFLSKVIFNPPITCFWANYYWAMITHFKGVLKVFDRT